MSIWTIDFLKEIWDNQNIMVVVIQHNGSSLGSGTQRIYYMGDYWKGGGHPGGSLVGYLDSRNYNFTSLLSNRHGSSAIWRLDRATEIGILGNTIDNNTLSQYGIDPPQPSINSITFYTNPNQNENSGINFVNQPVIHFLDSNGDLAQVNDSVTLSIFSGNGTLIGSNNINAVNGVASFSNLNILGSGNHVLKAQSGTFIAYSNNINILNNPITSLFINTQPTTTYINNIVTPFPKIILKDSNNNTVFKEERIIVNLINQNNTINNNISGDLIINTNSNGEVTFNNLSISVLGSSYKLRFTLESNQSIMSNSNYFDVNYLPVSYLYIEQNIPTSNDRNEIFTQQPEIHLKNINNEVVINSNEIVSINIKENNGLLVGQTSINAINGIAKFTDLKITNTGTWNLIAKYNTIEVDLNQITINDLEIDNIQFTTQPQDGFREQNLNNFVIETKDIYGVKVNFNGQVKIYKISGPGNIQDTLYDIQNGIINISDFKINTIGIYVIGAEINVNSKVISQNSNEFQIFNSEDELPSNIEFETQPSNTISTQIIPNIRLRCLDGSITPQLLTNFNGNVTIEVYNPSNIILKGSVIKQASNGIVSFDDLFINEIGTYTLKAFINSKIATFAISTNFDITLGEPYSLHFFEQPDNVISMVDFSLNIYIRDKGNNLITDSSKNVNLTLYQNPGNSKLFGDNSMNAINGIVNFNNLKLDKIGTYKIKSYLTDNNDISSISTDIITNYGNPFSIKFKNINNISNDDNSQNTINIINGNAYINLPVKPVLEIFDEGDNIVSNYNNNVNLSFSTNTSGKFVNNENDITINAINGVANFNNTFISFTKVGSYNLIGSTTHNLNIITTQINLNVIIDHGIEYKIDTYGFPSNDGFSMIDIDKKPIYYLKDEGDNLITTQKTINLDLYEKPEEGTISGDLLLTSSTGIFDFSENDIYFDKIGDYKIISKNGSITSIPSDNITISASNVYSFEITQQPSENAVSSISLERYPIITLYDKGGNIASSSNNLFILEPEYKPTDGKIYSPFLNDSFLNTEITVNSDKSLTYNNIIYDNIEWLENIPNNSENINYDILSIDPYINGTVQISKNGDNYYFKNKMVNYVHKFAENGYVDFSNNFYFDKTGDYTLKITISGTYNDGLQHAIVNDTIKFGYIDQDILDTSLDTVKFDTSLDTIKFNTNLDSVKFSLETIKFNDIVKFITNEEYNITNIQKITNNINITSDIASNIEIVNQPAGISDNNIVAGNNFTTKPSFNIIDSFSNISTQENDSITLSISGGDLLGDTSMTVINGVADFNNSNLSINKTGSYIIKASYKNLEILSNVINIIPSSTSKILFKIQPSGGTINNILNIQPVIEFYDEYDNITNANEIVTLSINTGPANSEMVGNKTIQSINGNANFTDIQFNTPGSYTIIASSGSFNVISNEIVIASLPINNIQYSQQPLGGDKNKFLEKYPIVKLYDINNDIVLSSQPITLNLVNIEGSTGTLLGNNIVYAKNGIADFSNNDIRISEAGKYKFSANIDIFTLLSDEFIINNHSLDNINFTSIPINTKKDISINPSININLNTKYNELYQQETDISLIIVPNNFSGITNKKTFNGNINFDNIIFNQIGTYNIKALAYPFNSNFTNISNDISMSFNLTVEHLPANTISFIQQPSNYNLKKDILNIQPIIHVKNILNNLIEYEETLTITINGDDNYLEGTKNLTSSNGIYEFNDLYLTHPNNYKLKAYIQDVSALSNEIIVDHKDIHSFNISGLNDEDYINNPINYDIILSIKDIDNDYILKTYEFTIDLSGTGQLLGRKNVIFNEGFVNIKNYNLLFDTTGIKQLKFIGDNKVFYSDPINIKNRDIKGLELLIDPSSNISNSQFTIYPSIRIIDVSNNPINSYNSEVELKLYNIDTGEYVNDLSGEIYKDFYMGHLTYSDLSITEKGNYKLIFKTTFDGIDYDLSSNLINIIDYDDYLHSINHSKAQQNIYDVIIIGAGPSGAMLAHELSKQSGIKILIIEKGIMTREKYITKYNELATWSQAMYDSNNKYNILTNNNDIILGQGNGGGTLHFGLQYIDQTDLTKKTNQILEDEINYVNQITKTVRYNHSDISLNTWNNFKNILLQSNLNVYNNKIYSRDKVTRFTAGDLIPTEYNILTGHENVEILYNANVNKILFENDTTVRGVQITRGDYYYGNKVVLCSGAIQTPCILQRSGIGLEQDLSGLEINVKKNLPVGNNIYDHGGFSLLYSSTTDYPNNIISHLQTRDISLNWQIYYSYIPTLPNTIITTIAQSTNLTGSGYVKINNKNLTRPIFDNYNNLLTNELIEQINNRINYFSEPIDNDFMNNNSNEIINKYIENKPLISQLSDIKKYWTPSNNIINNIGLPNNDVYKIETWFYIENNGKNGWFKNEIEIYPDISINYFNNADDQYENDLLNAFNLNHEALKNNHSLIGVTKEIINKQYIKNQTKSIYHYHGTCKFNEIVDNNHKVYGYQNLYIGDLSVINSPLPGSSSVPAMALGYRVSKSIINGQSETINGNIVSINIKTHPNDISGGENFTEFLTIEFKDISNNIVEQANPEVTLSLENKTDNNAILSGNLIKNASGGEVSFNDLSIDKIGTYTIKASINDPYYLETSTNNINISLGTLNKIEFIQQPVGDKENTILNVHPILATYDKGNNLLDINDGKIEITNLEKISGSSILSNVSGTLEKNIVNGKCEFNDLIINTHGTYKLEFKITHPLLNTTIKSGTFSITSNQTSSTLGDPYITPLFGPTYKLKDGNYYYRYIDNNDKNRFLVNFSTLILDKNKKDEIDNYILSIMQKQTGNRNLSSTIKYLNNKNLSLISDYCFVDKIYVNNNNSEFYFDLENFTFVKPFDNNFIVQKIDNEELFTQIKPYSNIKSICALKIITFNQTYGIIELFLFKYNNPQIRNSFKILTQKNINEKNTRGCILFKQKHSNITINGIKSDEIIPIPEFIIDNKNQDELFYSYDANISESYNNISINF